MNELQKEYFEKVEGTGGSGSCGRSKTEGGNGSRTQERSCEAGG